MKGLSVNPFGTRMQHSGTHMAGRRWVLCLTTCSDDSKPYMILVALIKGFHQQLGFAIIRASGERDGRHETSTESRLAR